MDRDLEVTVKLLNSADDIQRLIKFIFLNGAFFSFSHICYYRG